MLDDEKAISAVGFLRRAAETVDNGILKHSAISAAVIRNRRKDAIASTRSSHVRLGEDSGSDERSASPSAPSAR